MNRASRKWRWEVHSREHSWIMGKGYAIRQNLVDSGYLYHCNVTTVKKETWNKDAEKWIEIMRKGNLELKDICLTLWKAFEMYKSVERGSPKYPSDDKKEKLEKPQDRQWIAFCKIHTDFPRKLGLLLSKVFLLNSPVRLLPEALLHLWVYRACWSDRTGYRSKIVIGRPQWREEFAEVLKARKIWWNVVTI